MWRDVVVTWIRYSGWHEDARWRMRWTAAAWRMPERSRLSIINVSVEAASWRRLKTLDETDDWPATAFLTDVRPATCGRLRRRGNSSRDCCRQIEKFARCEQIIDCFAAVSSRSPHGNEASGEEKLFTLWKTHSDTLQCSTRRRLVTTSNCVLMNSPTTAATRSRTCPISWFVRWQQAKNIYSIASYVSKTTRITPNSAARVCVIAISSSNLWQLLYRRSVSVFEATTPSCRAWGNMTLTHGQTS